MQESGYRHRPDETSQTPLVETPETAPQVEFEILKNPETRERLRAHMGAFIREVHEAKIDTLIFLDRSARPLSWLFREMWPQIYPDKPQLCPEIHFVNIGTSSYVHKAGETHRKQQPNFGGDSALVSLSWEEKERLQQRLGESVEHHQWLTPADVPLSFGKSVAGNADPSILHAMYGEKLDYREVLIVDDISVSGQTELIALAIFSKSFPEALSFQATSFFHRAPDDLSKKDRDLIPWFQRGGLSGVLETPDVKFRSDALNTENAKSIADQLKARRELLVEDVDEIMKSFQSTLSELLLGCEQTVFDAVDVSEQERDQTRLKAFQQRLVLLADFMRAFDVNSDLPVSKVESFTKTFNEVLNDIPSIRTFSGFDYDRLTTFYYSQGWGGGVVRSLTDLVEVNQELDTHGDVMKLRRGHLQLRNEIRALAHESL